MRGAMIETETLAGTYETGSVKVRALKGVSVIIGEGEFVAVMGPSGSGKSTFLNLLGCLDRPTTGAYILDGTDVSTMSDDQLAAVRSTSIGFVFQGFNLLPRTSAEANIELPLTYTGEATEIDLPRRSWRPWGFPSAAATRPTSCPEASSSDWPSPAPWCSRTSSVPRLPSWGS